MKSGIFPVIIAIVLAGALFSGCDEVGLGERIIEKGEVITAEKAFADFTEVDVSSAFEVEITRSDSFSLIVNADETLFDLIEVSKDGQTLKIYINPRHIFTDFTESAEGNEF